MTISRLSTRLFSSTAQSALARNANSPLRWGILSAGRISSDYVKAMHLVPEAEPIAVAARSASKAQEFADSHNIPKTFGNYHDLIRNPDVDVVYIGTIADHHYEWTRESILAGKPTVVEKPMTLCADDTKELINLAKEKNVFLMEGMWTRCFPAMQKLRQIIASNEIGPIVYVQGDFGYSMANNGPEDRIWLPDSGGVTMDIGMYIAQFGRLAFPDGKLKDVFATGTVKNGVDHSVMATVTYERGDSRDGFGEDGLLQFALTGAANTEERMVLQGTKGRVVINGPFHVPQKMKVMYDQGRGESTEQIFDFPLPDDPYGAWNNPGSIGFVHQIREVGTALSRGKKECDSFTWNESLEVATVVDEIVRQVRGERPILRKVNGMEAMEVASS
mmetsp:Transcript_17931/g.37373  ORF Transcript_17931/g.37373 Transcript_17931/m.37373 type:complete len:389 (+) Transcript_17931:39-1205(+)